MRPCRSPNAATCSSTSGWYFQYPLFEYLYTGLDRVALAEGISAITGNPDLEPERTKVWELSLKYSLPFDIVASA